MHIKILRKTLSILVIVVLVLVVLPIKSVNAAPVFPPGFISEAVVTNLTGPTTITFAPDGRMFIGQKDGRVRVFQDGVLLPTDFINISAQVNNNRDRGLLGIAIHPDFPNTPYVYLLFTYDPPGTVPDGGGARVSRLLRVSANPNNTNVALPGSEVVLLGTNSTFANIGNPNNNDGPASCESGGVYVQDCIAADSPSHTIGTVTFGTDGSLFVSSGDGAHFNYTDVRALRSLSVDSLNGKILRINPLTGQGYPDNPFYNGNPNSNRSKIYNLGLRNPFRITINTLTNEPFIGDVGWNTWEEIDTGRGENFGWPCYEGNNVGSAQQGSYRSNTATSATCAALYAQGLGAVQAPLYAYNHSLGNSSVQAGGFYRGTVYPPQYQGALFFSDYNADWIRYLAFDSNGNVTDFDFATDVSPVGGIVQLLVGPDTNLYYVAYNGPTPNTSEVRRIRYVSGGNTPPTAIASADPNSGYLPLTVNFSSAGSFDPDNQPLTYLWNFGDGNSSTDPNPSYTYLANGIYTVILTVTDSPGESGTDTVNITIGNLPPVATIFSPGNGFTYNTDDIINYNGTGIDNEDGNLSGASLQWDILLHHNQHVHFDFIPGLTGNTGSFPIPDHGDNTWIELCLTATDSGGLNDQDCVNLLPNTVTLSFDTVPSGLELEYNGVTYTTPFSVITNVNSVRDLIAAPVQDCHTFTSWSDGGTASHQITVGASPQTYIATYAPCPITITVGQGQSKIYGNADPAYIYTSSDPTVALAGELSRAVGENVGAYAINQGTLATVDSKYAITTFIPADFTINPRPASVTPNPASKIYGSADPLFTGTLNGFLLADGVTAIYSRTAGETVAGSPYIISATLSPIGLLGNYTITFNTANFTIGESSATITLDNLNQTYDGAPNPVTVTTNPPGLIVDITYNGSPTAPTNAGSYAINATINDPNYVGTANSTLIIAQATANPIITVGDKIYDGTTAANITSRSLTGVIGPDDVTLIGGTANFADPNVGTWLVTATGLALSGSDAGNYQLSSTTATTTATITLATATVTTAIHDASHAPITSAALGMDIHGSAVVSGIAATPTGNVTFLFFANPTCTGPGTDMGTVPLDVNGAADPSNTATVTAAGLSFQATYNGDINYASQISLCESLGVQPTFNSMDNTTFAVGGAGSFTVTAVGSPTVTSITLTGALPAGVTFTDNGDGTATLAGTPAASTNGVYNLVLTATNGISPDAVQNFTLTVNVAAPPKVSPTAGINTNSPTRDNLLTESEIVRVKVTQFTVTFDQDVVNVPSGDPNYGDSMINPANYMLVRDNGNGFETNSCNTGIGGDDTLITIDSITYKNNNGAGPFVATLSINGSLPLSDGSYRLYICGTTSITNLFGVKLAGDGVNAGTDFVRNFTISIPAGGGGNGGRGTGNTSAANTAIDGGIIPVSGFAPDTLAQVPEQPEALAYTSTGDMRLEIPSLGVNIPIVGVRQTKTGWDLTWLGNNAGYLESSAYPTWQGNTVLTAHVLDSRNVPGPFANVNQLKENNLIYIHVNELTYVYRVEENLLVSPFEIDKVFKHEDYDWLTLVTCENYYKMTKTYLSRRVVRAVLISVLTK